MFHINGAIANLRGVRQKISVTEREFYTRLTKAVYDNRNAPVESIATVINVVHPTIQTMVPCFRMSNQNVAYLDVIDFPRLKVHVTCVCVETANARQPFQIAAEKSFLPLLSRTKLNWIRSKKSSLRCSEEGTIRSVHRELFI